MDETARIRQMQANPSSEETGMFLEERLGLVYFLARQMGQAITEDMKQAGLLGLYQALLRFDPDNGVSFGTYAAHYVRKELYRAIRETSGAYFIPERRYLLFLRIARVVDQCGEGEAALEEAAEQLALPLAYVQQAVSCIGAARCSYKKAMALSETPSAEEVFLHSYAKRSILDMVSALTPRERQALAIRFRFPPYDGREGEAPYEEVARLMGISIARAQVLAKAGLAKVRQALQNGSVDL